MYICMNSYYNHQLGLFNGFTSKLIAALTAPDPRDARRLLHCSLL